MATKKIRARTLGRTTSVPGGPQVLEVILHEGWCVKESGTAFLGKTNWRKRWFKLVQRGPTVSLEYFKSRGDRNPAGSVRLDVTYSTRQIENREKSQSNCFAVGPLVDDGAIRTYYISCSSLQSMEEWLTVIDAAIQGVPELAQRRRQTISHQFSIRNNSRRVVSRSLSTADSLGDIEERALDLSTSAATPNQATSSLGATVDSGIQHEDLSDDEVWESVEGEVSEEEGEEVDGASVSIKKRYCTTDSDLKPAARLSAYDSNSWRIEHWLKLCHAAATLKWSKVDTKDGVTVSRCKFGRGNGGNAVIKVEGVLQANPSTVYQFMQLSTREGGKLDYLFRNEQILHLLEDDPAGSVIFNQFLLPLPRVSKRDVVAMKIWVPQYLSQDESSGMVMFSVDHPDATQPERDSKRINIKPSGLILKCYPGPGGAVHTKMTILVQIALYGALHRMLKGAYNSGLLKLGIRSTFVHIKEQLEKFVQITSI
ncbi:uncharacterized protein LOC135351142 [Halichondria panicea]|uniref:uncharacterized protein LOC135351142 n=1 Tax=Halichondria panicea TaxID=6063 RepID=UPI00312BC70A